MAVGNGSSIAALGVDPVGHTGDATAIDASGSAGPGEDARAGPVPGVAPLEVAPLGMEGGETLLASVDVVGNAYLGVGARGGALNWAGVGVDVGEAAEATVKWLQGKHLEPGDEVSLYGLFEGSLKELGPLTELVNRLVGARGLSVEAHTNVTIDLVATEDGGLRLGAITLAALPVVPEKMGGRFPKPNYRDWSTLVGVHRWEFDEDGTVSHDSQLLGGAGAFNAMNGSQQGDAVTLPGMRGNFYVLATREQKKLSDAGFGLAPLANFIPDGVPGSPNGTGTGSQFLGRASDLAVAGEVARALGASLAGQENLTPDGEPRTTTVRGWARFIQAVTPEQAALPPSVPMWGVLGEVNGIAQLKEDGDHVVRVRTTNMEEPIEFRLNDLKGAGDRLNAALEGAARSLEPKRAPTIEGAQRDALLATLPAAARPPADILLRALFTRGEELGDALNAVAEAHGRGGRNALVDEAHETLRFTLPQTANGDHNITDAAFAGLGMGERASGTAKESYDLLRGEGVGVYEAWETVWSVYLFGYSGPFAKDGAETGIVDGGYSGGSKALNAYRDWLRQ